LRLATQAESDDVGSAQIRFASGARGVINSSSVSPKTYYLRLYGSQANLLYETDMSIWPNAEKVDPSTMLTLVTPGSSERIPFETRDMLAEELDEFAQCVRGDAEPETGASGAIAALAVICGASESAETGRLATMEKV
jgi:predicted dehydrogenase